MKNALLTIGVLMSFTFCHGQTEKLSEADIQFDLPNQKWALKDRQVKNNLLVLYYKREPIIDKSGRQIIPNIVFIVETVPDTTDLVIYSAQRRANANIDVKEVLTCNDKNSVIKHKYAIGYKGTYVDKGLEHTIYVIHLIHKDKGVRIFFDITSELFPKYEKEFLKTISSIKNIHESPNDGHLETETININDHK